MTRREQAVAGPRGSALAHDAEASNRVEAPPRGVGGEEPWDASQACSWIRRGRLADLASGARQAPRAVGRRYAVPARLRWVGAGSRHGPPFPVSWIRGAAEIDPSGGLSAAEEERQLGGRATGIPARTPTAPAEPGRAPRRGPDVGPRLLSSDSALLAFGLHGSGFRRLLVTGVVDGVRRVRRLRSSSLVPGFDLIRVGLLEGLGGHLDRRQHLVELGELVAIDSASASTGGGRLGSGGSGLPSRGGRAAAASRRRGRADHPVVLGERQPECGDVLSSARRAPVPLSVAGLEGLVGRRRAFDSRAGGERSFGAAGPGRSAGRWSSAPVLLAALQLVAHGCREYRSPGSAHRRRGSSDSRRPWRRSGR